MTTPRTWRDLFGLLDEIAPGYPEVYGAEACAEIVLEDLRGLVKNLQAAVDEFDHLVSGSCYAQLLIDLDCTAPMISRWLKCAGERYERLGGGMHDKVVFPKPRCEEDEPSHAELRWERAAAWARGQSDGPYLHNSPESLESDAEWAAECERIRVLKDLILETGERAAREEVTDD